MEIDENMVTSETKRYKAPIDRLVPADWNYKKEGDPEEKEKFKSSILDAKSAGTLAVRELENGYLEVLDGNHRLEAVTELGWTHVDVEDFGKISLARAFVLARRFNYQWFSDDPVALARGFKAAVDEFGLDEITEFMPDTAQEIQDQLDYLEFDWNSLPDNGKNKKGGEAPQEFVKIELSVPRETYNIWFDLKEALKEERGFDSDETCFDHIVKKAAEK